MTTATCSRGMASPPPVPMSNSSTEQNFQHSSSIRPPEKKDKGSVALNGYKQNACTIPKIPCPQSELVKERDPFYYYLLLPMSYPSSNIAPGTTAISPTPASASAEMEAAASFPSPSTATRQCINCHCPPQIPTAHHNSRQSDN